MRLSQDLMGLLPRYVGIVHNRQPSENCSSLGISLTRRKSETTNSAVLKGDILQKVLVHTLFHLHPTSTMFLENAKFASLRGAAVGTCWNFWKYRESILCTFSVRSCDTLCNTTCKYDHSPPHSVVFSRVHTPLEHSTTSTRQT